MRRNPNATHIRNIRPNLKSSSSASFNFWYRNNQIPIEIKSLGGIYETTSIQILDRRIERDIERDQVERDQEFSLFLRFVDQIHFFPSNLSPKSELF